jgi:Fe-S-cluster-containing hydrogenase component 2
MSMKFEFPESCDNGGSCGCSSEDKTAKLAPALDPVDVSRRWFMKAATAFTTTALAPGVTLMAFAEAEAAHARPADQPVSSKQRWGLLIDASKCADGCTDCIVLVDRHICIGCRYCMMACPYKARSFVHEPLQDQKPYAPRGKGCVESCTMCVHRVDAGGTPACVEACAKAGHAAMIFGDLNDKTSEIAKRVATYRTTRVRDDLGTDPGVYYQNI